MTDERGLHVVIPAGGVGTRLWPLSRSDRPKFLLDLTGSGRTLLQHTWDRLAPLGATITVVTGARHERQVAEQLPDLRPEHLIVEPSPRDSMAAIGLAAALRSRREPDAVLGSFPADHVIEGDAEFATAVAEAAAAAADGYVCVVGLAPARPSTAYGYVRAGDRLPNGALQVHRFTEKPDEQTARSYLATGHFLWNAGMFVTRADVLLGHLQRQLPLLHDGLMAIAEAWDTVDRADTLARIWPTLTRIPIDHAIAEPLAVAGGMACVLGTFRWDDVGDFAALARLLPGGDVKVLGEPARVRTDDSTGVIVTGERAITVLGVPDAVVVDTPDALLVTTTAHAQRVAQIRAAWQGARGDLL